MATVEDLVRVSGYSRSTVFRFLSGKSVRRMAREAIIAAARETGFGAVTRENREDVCLLFSAPVGFEGFRGFADAAEGIIRRAGELGLPLFFDENRSAGKRLAAICLGKKKAEEDEEFERRKKLGQTVVFVNRMIDDSDASWVSVDFSAAAADAASRLAAAGCRRIAVWANPDDRRVDEAKLRGAIDYARNAQNPIDILVFGPANGEVEDVARQALSCPDRPDGWLAISDEIAMRIIRVAYTLGLRVPEDFSVVGMNDVESAAYFTPPLTSVHIPFRDCGIAAVDIAQRLLDNPSERSVRIRINHRLVERESCAPIGHLSR